MAKNKKGENNPRYKTGLTMNGGSSLYHSWENMKQRCTNPKHPKYQRYGGRGVKICTEWLHIEGFRKWALDAGWQEGLSIDRINNDGDYCPENCRWVTMSENSRHKRTTKIDMITAQEIRSRIKEDWYELAEEYGCTYGNIWFIMHNLTHVPDGECAKRLKERRSEKLQTTT